MYRLSIVKALPFQKTSYCEDAIWAKEALSLGHTIVYNPAARVYHYHLQDEDFTFKVSLTGMYFKYKHFNYTYLAPSLSVRKKLGIMKTLLKTKNISFREKWNWYLYNVNQHKTEIKAYKVFMEALKKGETELDEVHFKLCGKPPIPVKLAS